MYIYIYIYIHIFILYKCTYIYIYTYIYLYYTNVHIYIYIHIFILYKCTYIYIYHVYPNKYSPSPHYIVSASNATKRSPAPPFYRPAAELWIGAAHPVKAGTLQAPLPRRLDQDSFQTCGCRCSHGSVKNLYTSLYFMEFSDHNFTKDV